MKTIGFKSSYNSGDILYHLSAIKAVCEKQQAKAHLYLWIDRVAAYYPGCPPHPVKDITGKKDVSLNLKMYTMLKPLLEAQPYIEAVEMYNGEQVTVDLDLIKQRKVGQPMGDLRQWPGFVFPDMVCDIGEGALFLPEHKIEMNGAPDNRYIIVNRTERYLNTFISYHFLKAYPVVLFVGVPKEYSIFRKEVPNAVHIHPENFLELAKLVKNAALTIGNQSMTFAIAEQLKAPRVLEVCEYAPNVIVAGGNGYPFYGQAAVEYYVEKLWRGEVA